MIAIIDYKAGNLTSVMKSFAAVGAAARVTDNPDEIGSAERVVLPGVGHFSATMRLRELGIDAAVRALLAKGTPFLGICVGLQWLFEGSGEAPTVPGLGAIPGCCARFPEGQRKVPHVGWNTLEVVGPSRLLAGLPSSPFVYYTHSYRAPVVAETVGVTDYVGAFSGAVERGNLFGVQFHPEKSGDVGLQILRNFLAAQRC